MIIKKIDNEGKIKNNNDRKSTIIVSVVIIAWIIVLLLVSLYLSGMFKINPKVDVTANNNYDKTLKVVIDEDYKPYSFYDNKGQLSGYDIELMNIVANKLHYNLDIKGMSWNQSVEEVINHNADIVMTCDKTDKALVDRGLILSSTTSEDKYVAFGKNETNYVGDLYGKKIGAMKNGNVVSFLSVYELDNNLVLFDSNEEAIEAMHNDKVDYVCCRYIVGQNIINKKGYPDVYDDVTLGSSEACLGLTDKNLEKEINVVLEELKKDGTIEKLENKWLTTFVKDYSLKEIVYKYPVVIITWILVFAITLVIIVYGINIKRKINEEKTNNKIREKALKKEESANKAKAEFLFNMSHDIRTPASAIVGFSNIAKRHIDDKDKLEDVLDKIKLSSEHLLTIIDDVLEMSKIESGNMKIEVIPVDIMDFGRGFNPMLDSLAIAKSIKYEFVIQDIKNRYLFIDVVHMNRVIVNLVSNAIKYTDEGGKVSVMISEISSDTPDVALIRFMVMDNGIGMSEKFISKMFEQFSRENTSTVSGQKGVGLGLSISKSYIDAFGGTIEVYSEIEKGTTVVVDIPFKIDIDKSEVFNKNDFEEINNNDITFRGKKVLLVDDNELNREIAKDILEEEGFKVDTAEDGDFAVSRIKYKGVEYYDYIFMDIQMPVMDGYEATRRIRSLENGNNIIIIALSANAFDEDKKKSLEAGMNAHVSKPIDVIELRKVILDISAL